MILTTKPEVYSVLAPGGRLWRVEIDHTEGRYVEHWRNRVTALNCALAIARTSRFATEEERCKRS